MKIYLLALAMLVTVLAGCGQSNPVKTAKGNYYYFDARVTAADSAVLKYMKYPDCVTTANMLPCSKTSVRARLADATQALGHATDAYSQTVRDPAFTQGGLAAASAAVDFALTALTAILAEIGVTP